MDVTDIKIRKVESRKSDSKLLAYVAVTFNNSLVLHNIKIIKGQKGLFIAMPNRKTRQGEYKDIVHPINQKFREYLQNSIFDEYKKQYHLDSDNMIVDESQYNV